MSSRLYFNNETIPYTPATIRGAWDATATPSTGKLGVNPVGAAVTITKTETVATNLWDVLYGRWVSDGLQSAMTIAGTIDFMLRASEANAAANAFYHLHIYVTQGNSDTPRGTLLSDWIGSTEFSTTAGGLGATGVTLSSLACQAGDRIVIEVGVQFQNTVTTSYNTVVAYGGTNGTDLTTGNTTAGMPKWIQFSDNVAFKPKLSTLTDNFDDNSIDAAKWTNWGGANVTETNQRLQVVGTVTADDYFGMDAVGYYDATGERNFIQIVNIGVGATDANRVIQGIVYQPSNGDNSCYVEISGGFVFCYKNVLGVFTQVGTAVAYNSTTHAYIGMRESGGTLYYECSADGSTWGLVNTDTSTAVPFHLAAVLVSIATVGNVGTVGSASFGYFDNFNVTGSTAFTKSLSDSVTTADDTAKGVVLAKADTASVADAILKVIGKLLGDTTAASDSLAKQIGYQRALGDSAGATDAIAKAVGKMLADNVTPADAILVSKVLALMLSDSVTASDAIAKVFGKRLTDTATAADAQTRSQGYKRTLTDAATATDAISKKPTKINADVALVGLGQNILLNPDFETGTGNLFTGWGLVGTTITADTSPNVRDGTRSLKMVVDGANTLVGITQLGKAVVPGRQYYLMIVAKSDTPGQLQFALTDPSANYVSGAAGTTWSVTQSFYAFNTTTNWSVIVQPFVPAPGQTVVHLSDLKRSAGSSQAGRTFWIDGVYIYDHNTVKAIGKRFAETVTSLEGRVNYIPNPSMEANAYWSMGAGIDTGTPAYRSTTQKLFGTYSMKLDKTSVPSAQHYLNGASVPFTPRLGQTYVFSIYVYVETPGVSTIQMGIRDWTSFAYKTRVAGLQTWSVTVGQWIRIFYAATCTIEGEQWRFTVADPNTADAIWYCDGALVEHGTVPGDYFDGSFPGALWTGTAHNSVSTLPDVAKAVGKSLTDTATVTDDITRRVQFARTLADSVTPVDATQKRVGKFLVDTVTVTDALRKAYGMRLADAVVVADAVAKTMRLLLADAVVADDEFQFVLIKAAVAVAEAIDIILDNNQFTPSLETGEANVSLEPEGTVVIVDNRNFDVPLEQGNINVELER